MKFMIIAVLAVVAIAQALPFGEIGAGIGLSRVAGGIGLEGGIRGIGGLAGLGREYGGGSSYGRRGYARGSHGYGSRGYAGGATRTGHNVGGVVNDYSSEVHHHQAASHNIGGISQVHGAGHSREGYGNYGEGNRGYGRHWNQGRYMA